MPPKQIPLFEEQNPEIAINLYAVDPGNTDLAFTIEYLSPQKERQHHVNLLLLEELETGKSHYTWIRDMSRLVSHRTNHHGKQCVCSSCFHPFTSKESHDNHLSYCQSHLSQQVKYPDPADSVLKFKSVQKHHPVPFYLVCDFESFLTPSNTDDNEEDDVDASSGRIRTIDEHKVSGFCCYRVTSYPQYQTPPTLYSGADDVMDVFYQHVYNELNIINWIVSDNVEKLPFTPEQKAEFEAATICGNCEKPFTDDNNNVRHHCHISGKFLFPCCNNCNLQLKLIAYSRKNRQNKIEKRVKAGEKRHLQTTVDWAADQYEDHFFLAIIFHNLKNYDAHCVIKHFQKKIHDARPENEIWKHEHNPAKQGKISAVRDQGIAFPRLVPVPLDIPRGIGLPSSKSGQKTFRAHSEASRNFRQSGFREGCLSLQLHDGAQKVQGDATSSDQVFPGHLER